MLDFSSVQPILVSKLCANIVAAFTGLPDDCSPILILKFMKHKTLTYWLNSKDNPIPPDIIDTINGDISDDDFT